MSVQEIAQLLLNYTPFLLLGMGVLLLLLKGNFTQPEDLPSKSHGGIFALFFLVCVIIPTGYLGWGYYQAYFPDYKYDEVASSVTFHVYQPSYLPDGVQLESRYSILEQNQMFEGLPSVRVMYGNGIEHLTQGDKRLIAITQSQVPAQFELKTYLDSTVAKEGVNFTEITLANFPNTNAVIQSGSIVNAVWVLTNDGVLISFVSPITRTPTEELVKMADSLR